MTALLPLALAAALLPAALVPRNDGSQLPEPLPLPFDGTGGPGGNFDVVIPAGTTLVFNTVSTVFVGGPGGQPTTQQIATNGRLDVRDLIVEEGAKLVVSGPNPCRILATGNVVVDGEVLAEGGDSNGVVTLNTATVPEPGAPGRAGGGRGGTGSYLTTESTPRGGRGFGAFDIPNGGGEGGEAAYNPTTATSALRRAAGGGGGRFGRNVKLVPESACEGYDDNVVGLDAEPGFGGFFEALSSLDPTRPPRGGRPGPRPFRDALGANDFYGRLVRADGSVECGELPLPWAGAGGGAGGDAVPGTVFPHPNFSAFTDEKGAGGGGGGGSLHFQVVGDFVVGPRGLVSVRGGTGGGGENATSLDRIGGGSGGGSGGHLIVETLSQIDLSAVLGSVPSAGWTLGTSEVPSDVGLIATRGQGGAGAMNAGGAGGPNHREVPCEDARPESACPIDGAQEPVIGGGGDGGPGLIQLHVLELVSSEGPGDVLPPVDASLFEIGLGASSCPWYSTIAIKNAGVIKPPPVGAPHVARASDTFGWDRLVPAFPGAGRASSTWTPLPKRPAKRDAALRRAVTRFRATLPADASGRATHVQVQAAPATLAGAPDTSALSRWVEDADELAGGDWRWVRVRAMHYDVTGDVTRRSAAVLSAERSCAEAGRSCEPGLRRFRGPRASARRPPGALGGLGRPLPPFPDSGPPCTRSPDLHWRLPGTRIATSPPKAARTEPRRRFPCPAASLRRSSRPLFSLPPAAPAARSRRASPSTARSP